MIKAINLNRHKLQGDMEYQQLRKLIVIFLAQQRNIRHAFVFLILEMILQHLM